MIRFTILGAVRAWRDNIELPLGPPQQRAILALLLAGGGRPASLSELVDLLWEANPPASAVNIVHRYVGALRRVFEPGLPPRAPGRWLIRHAGGYRVAAEAGNLDLLRFRELAGRARQAMARHEPRQAVLLFIESLNLCQGICAGDLPAVREHPAFTSVDQECLVAAREAADVALEAGLAQQVLPVLRYAAIRDPLAEPLQARLMLVLAATGHQAEALGAYEKTRVRLAEELGIDPGPEIREAHGRVLRQQVATERPSPRTTGTPRTTDASRATGTPRATGTLGITEAVGASGIAAVFGTYKTMGASGALRTDIDDTVAAPRAATPALPPSQAALSSPVVRPAQLPADLPTFSGRRDEVAHMSFLMDSDWQAARVMLIGAIDGMPGAGKTTLAVHLAHMLAGRFPDGQLYVNLRGFDPGGTLSPTEVLRGFLEALGMPPQRIPADLNGQAALYRSLLSGQRVLVVLDNARDVAHVRPLLPGSPGCMVIVTSRNCLRELVASDSAHLLTVDVFSLSDAREALARRLGAARVDAEPEAVDEIISLSGRLPLALALVAARATIHRDFPLAAIAAELREAQGSLDAFSDSGKPDVRSVFFWSYRMLSPHAARLFRLLSLQWGPDISLAAAASLGGAPVRQTRALVAELTRARLLTEHRPSRFVCHDLLRSYAFELCSEMDTDADRQAAVSRILAHYLHSAHNSYLLFRSPQLPLALDPAGPAVSPEEPADFTAALEWFTAQQRVLEAMVRYAAQHGLTKQAWQLAYQMTYFYQRKGFWHDWAATARTALDAARESGDLSGQAHMHRILAGAFCFLGDNTAALAELERTRELFTQLGYSTEHAYLHSNFGAVLGRIGHYDAALGHHRQALELYRAAGNRIGEALAMAGIGSCANRLGKHDEAIASIQDAMSIHTELDDSAGEANSLESLSQSYLLLGEYGRAGEVAERSLELYRELGYQADEALVLVVLANIRLAAGERTAARTSLTQALAIFGELHLPQADEVRKRLTDLGLALTNRSLLVNTGLRSLVDETGRGGRPPTGSGRAGLVRCRCA